jgi:hypothetical protein
MRRLWLVGVLAAVALGAVLRVACLGAEFWLDEIWSWELAHQGAGVFRLRHDNNHHLNTLWLSLCAGDAPLWVYRLLSLTAGLAGIVLAAVAARGWGPADAVFASLLTACCYWLVSSAAEARGYSLAVCFALAAFLALRRFLESGSRPALVAFWLSSIAGFLSHLTFVHAYLGFVAWTMRARGGGAASRGDEIKGLLLCHGVPALFFAPFYLLCIRKMEVGGGPAVPPAAVLGSLVGVGLGGPAEGWQVLPWVALACGLFGVGLRRLAREGGATWVFFAVAVVASPALFLIPRPPFLFERYFLIPFVFFLLLAGHVLGTLWRQGWLARRLLALIVLTAILAGNTAHVLDFVRAGRGEFRQALAWVARNDPAAVVEVAGDHDFRVRKYVEFYARRVDGGRVKYLGEDELPAGGAAWLLVHRLDDRHPPGEVEHDQKGNPYRLVRGYPSRGPGCWGWFVYRRER